jgi:arylsulfatase A-like enzyme
MRRLLKSTAVLGLACVAAACVERGSRYSATPARVVLIVIDTLRKDHLPFYGYSRPTAPFLAKLTASGVVFENAHSASSWTAPATATIFTSLYPFQHRVVTGFRATQKLAKTRAKIDLNRIPAEVETLGEVMHKAGYATYAVTENPNLVSEMGFDQGFDEFTSFPRFKTADFITERLKELKPRLDRERRYFLYLHFMDVHDPREERPPLFDPSLEGAARKISAYDSEIHYVDSHIEQAHKLLGWDTDTLLVVTADHGEQLLDRGEWGHGENLYAEVLNVPLLMVFPGRRKAGLRIAAHVSHVDLLPTLRELVGLPASAEAAGTSLVPLLAGGASAPRDRGLFCHLYRDPGYRGRRRETLLEGAISGNWKWIGGMAEGAKLYDIQKDPTEQVNLASERPQIASGLERLYREFEARSRKFKDSRQSLELDAESQEHLRALGYVN